MNLRLGPAIVSAPCYGVESEFVRTIVIAWASVSDEPRTIIHGTCVRVIAPVLTSGLVSPNWIVAEITSFADAPASNVATSSAVAPDRYLVTYAESMYSPDSDPDTFRKSIAEGNILVVVAFFFFFCATLLCALMWKIHTTHLKEKSE
jgi:hypothetical protein